MSKFIRTTKCRPNNVYVYVYVHMYNVNNYSRNIAAVKENSWINFTIPKPFTKFAKIKSRENFTVRMFVCRFETFHLLHMYISSRLFVLFHM